MQDETWILNEEAWETSPTETATSFQQNSPSEYYTGQDPDDVVTISVTSEADVVSVTLAREWQDIIAPPELRSSVLSAVNAATTRALAEQFETGTNAAPTRLDESQQPSGKHSVDDSPLNAETLEQLLDAVTDDVRQFTQRLSSQVDGQSTVESSGGHITGSGLRGQITGLTIDPRWASTARNSEIEAELTDLLNRIKRADSPGDLAHGPSSSNIDELNALVSDPRRFLRKLGLTPPDQTDTNGTGTR